MTLKYLFVNLKKRLKDIFTEDKIPHPPWFTSIVQNHK